MKFNKFGIAKNLSSDFFSLFPNRRRMIFIDEMYTRYRDIDFKPIYDHMISDYTIKQVNEGRYDYVIRK